MITMDRRQLPGRYCRLWLLVTFSLSVLSYCYGDCCGNGWLSFQDSCYLFGNGAGLHFTEAEHYCKQHGAHLVSIDSRVEDLFLRDFIARLKGDEFWIGLTDEVVEGIWTWHWNDQPANYTGWGPGEPNSNNGDQDCVFITMDENYMWADIQCTNFFRPLCEKSKTTNGITGIVG